MEDIVIDKADLMSYMTGGIVISGTNLDLLRLKTVLYQLMESGSCSGFKVVHFQITPEHLRIVKRDEWEKWKQEK